MATEPNAQSILAAVAAGGNSLLSVAPLTAAMPPDADPANATLPAGWLDAGWADESGLTEKITQTINDIPAFGTVSPVRSVVKSGKFEFDISLLETNAVTLALANRKDFSAVSVAAGTGKVGMDVGGAELPRFQALFDVVDGNNLVRYYLGLVAVTAVGNTQYANGEAIKYPLTMTAYPYNGTTSVRKSYVLDALKYAS